MVCTGCFLCSDALNSRDTRDVSYEVVAADIDDDDAAAPPVDAAAPPFWPRPLSALPVTLVKVSLLFRPVGCKSSRGMLSDFGRYLPATNGPAIKATKMMSITK